MLTRYSMLILLVALCNSAMPQSPRPIPGDYSSSAKINYVRTWNVKAPESSGNAILAKSIRDAQQSTLYIDGLGRPLQTVIKQGSLSDASLVDLIDMAEYDVLGRQPHKYLPFSSIATDGTQNTGNFKINPFAQQVQFYNNQLAGQSGETNITSDNLNWAYSKINYEASPLNRVDNSYAPGSTAVGSESALNETDRHAIRMRYLSNTETDAVRKWTVADYTIGGSSSNAVQADLVVASHDPGTTEYTATNSITFTTGFQTAPDDYFTASIVAGITPPPDGWGTYTSTGIYGAGELYKTIAFDEHDKQVIEFKDKNGRILLKKVQLDGTAADDGSGTSHEGWMCTYYIYDYKGLLRCIVTPAATEALRLQEWNLMGIENLLERACYCYEYDKKGQLIRKKTPAVTRADATYYVYDERGRLVLTQDGKQRKSSVNVWIAAIYDQLDRLVLKGTYITAATHMQLIDGAAGSSAYPFGISNQPDAATWTVLTEIGYDTYASVPGSAGLTAGLDATYTSSTYLSTASASPVYALQPIQSIHTKGKVTWSRSLNLGENTYLYTLNIYDDRGRLIQQKTTNYVNGKDVITIQYNWEGQPIRIVDKTEFPGVHTNVVLTDIVYDDLGRESQVQKKIYNSFLNNSLSSTPWTVVSKTAYDALGQVIKIELGKKKDPATGSYTDEPLEHLNYAYNVRGELLGINRKLLEGSAGSMPAMSTNGNYFGMELGYDKSTASASGASYTGLRYDGAIAGVVWKTRGDQAGRQYSYTYDAANRLTAAAFKQNAQGTADWNNTTFNFSESVGQYDLNDNIKALSRNGLTINSSPVIDNLAYSYNSYENKPFKITDAGIATGNMNLGDFVDGSNTDDDYSYNNGNGSLTSDLNKGISAITYWSTTEKPQTITTTKGSINYIYNDDGTKLRKVYVENPSAANGNKTITFTTNYVGSMVFESRDIQPDDPQRPDYTNKLLFSAFAEGRIRALYNNNTSPNTLTGFAYDYFVKDHLGSIRMILTDEIKINYYPAATLEGTYSAGGTAQANSMVNFEKRFYNIDYTKVKLETDIPSWPTESTSNTKLYYNNNGVPNANYPAGCTPTQTDGSTRLYELNAATGNKTGLEFVIKVMAGDKVSIFGKSYYLNTNTVNNSNSTALDLIALMTNLLAVPGNPAGSKGLSAAQLNSTNSGLIPSSFFRGSNNEASTTVPKAYINYIFFDEQFKYAGGNFSRVGSSGTVKDHFNDAAMQEVAVPKNGYLFVYVSNESNMPVYFDNLQVVHKPGPVLEESHYYPYGLKIVGISSKAFGVINNPFQFQGNYSSVDEHTGWNDFELRSYDAQVGRWTTADPYDQFASPYVGMAGNPASYVDPDGGAAIIPPSLFSQLAGSLGPAVANVAARYSLANTLPQLTAANMSISSGLGPDNEYKVIKKNGEVVSVELTGTGGGDFFDKITTIDHDKPIPYASAMTEEYASVHIYEANLLSVDESIVRVPGAIIINTWRRSSGSAGDGLDLSDAIPTKAGAKVLLGGFIGGAIKSTAKSVAKKKVSGWVKRAVFNELDPAIQRKVSAAIKNGIVAPIGKQGIIKLTALEVETTGYLYKIKILGKGGDIRIYGNPLKNGHILFDKISGH
ncbi:MAG: DUF6443 domain-containing protein [Agriterribacter sp.]